ncbi:hypothetical protein [Nocardioides sp. AN3]
MLTATAGRVASASERIETIPTPAGRVASASERIETPTLGPTQTNPLGKPLPTGEDKNWSITWN